MADGQGQWDISKVTGTSIIDDVKAMIAAVKANKAFGPYQLIIPPVPSRAPRRVKENYYFQARSRRREKLVRRWFRREGMMR
jgi:hypothetical protein